MSRELQDERMAAYLSSLSTPDREMALDLLAERGLLLQTPDDLARALEARKAQEARP